MRIVTILLISLMLVACATTGNSRYQDNANLERPPELPIDKQAAEQMATNEIEPPKRRHGKGLGPDVYIVEGSPPELKIKRSFDETWSLLSRAIQHNDLKVTDQDRSKGFYYVAYNGGSFLSSATSLFDDVQNKSTYLLKVESQGEETRVTASLASKDEQGDSGSLKDGFADYSENKSSKLLELLYDTLHDNVKDE
ncbi:outer membrane protein assembly factor BamC [Methyloglobulus sp.]|uniref:outer membrane protein assembly factor BamC n=1 Tax=Methyloglobulus sp. TaxID=2518622 RepID=UPI003988BC50